MSSALIFSAFMFIWIFAADSGDESKKNRKRKTLFK